MWDFSWLERRWPGAGYEDWGRALDELAERGYDAVRIDAYPHFLATPGGAEKTWELLPCWHFLDWGAPCRTRVRVMPALTDFIALCRERKIKVGLSTWFRQDVDDVRIHIADARQHGDMWVRTLELIRDSGLLDAICYVDLCNEWPIAPWAPFFKFHSKDPDNGSTAESRAWMAAAIRVVRSAFPDVPYTFSCWPDTKDESLEWPELDFFEPHIWMAQQRDFYARVGYTYQKYDIAGLELVASKGEATYRANERYWQEGLIESIDRHAAFSRRQKRLLATTECWGVVDYRDWPLLDWGWVKELCELGTRRAAQTGRWWAIATSNFCGPQFHGMWRDVAWHQKLARAIRSSQVEKAGT
jgi:hypothetical protein